ncbi:MAG: (d)CMP kinase [Bacteriovoracaceae bacterium]|nr:(d)CMP kinase [Bacteriovoracaceae bacterium]
MIDATFMSSNKANDSLSKVVAKVIAIDGPSGSGKSTVAKNLAVEMNVLYIDTGAMFRALGYVFDKEKLVIEDSEKNRHFLNNLKMEYGLSESELIVINNENLTEKIREHHVSKLASQISQLPFIREYLLKFQRSLALDRVCVMEGRDIGTVVFPNSFAKFFITASVETRALRRLNQLVENGDNSHSLEQIIDDVKKRDETDMNREVAPLKKADDAELIDTTNLKLLEITSLLVKKIHGRAQEFGIQL